MNLRRFVPIFVLIFGLSETMGSSRAQSADSVSVYGDFLYHLQAGRHAEADHAAQRMLSATERRHGVGSSKFLTLANLLSRQYVKHERHDRAVPLLRHVLWLSRKKLDPNNPTLATVLQQLGQTYAALERHDAAADHLQEALTIRENAFGANHVEVAKTQLALALFYYERGRSTDAEPLFTRAIATIETVDDPELAPILEDHARAFREAGRNTEAGLLENRAQSLR